MGMDIAVIIGEVGFISHKDMVDGILDEAKALILQKLGESNIPVVSINVPTYLSRSAVVELENASGIHRALEHLVHVHGAKNIHYISGPQHNQDARERKEAFFEAMMDLGLPCGEEAVSYGDYEYQSGHRVVKQFVKNGCQMLFLRQMIIWQSVLCRSCISKGIRFRRMFW